MKIKHQKLFFILFIAVIVACGWGLAEKGHMKVEAAEVKEAAESDTEPDTKVKPVSIDYDALWLKVDANKNKKVYYSDKSKKIWYEAKPTLEKEKIGEVEIDVQYYYIDISWLSSTAKSVINLKGDNDDEVVSIELPARNSKFKAKYDKAAAVINFENYERENVEFQWRKATSYKWNTAKIVDGKSDADFQKEIEKLRISGATIYVRLPQTLGHIDTVGGKFEVGARQSKEIKISITKLAAAPKVTIDGTKLLLNTKETMEYSIDRGNGWEPYTAMKAKMKIADISENILYKPTTNAVGFTHNTLPTNLTTTQSVNILIRTAKTTTKAASKSFLLTIPAQRPEPSVVSVTSRDIFDSVPKSVDVDVVCYVDESKVYMKFNNASKTKPYEYLVVKSGTPDLTKGWKAVTTEKTISISSKTAPDGSVIYIRKKTIQANTKNKIAFEIASAYQTILVKYVKSTSTN